MSLTVRQLNRKAVNEEQISAVVRDQLKIIDDKILNTQVNWGKNTTTFILPNNLQFPGLDKSNAQRIVYHGILKSLKKRGFEVEILIGESKSTLFISWVTGIDTDRLTEMDRYITRHLVTEPPQRQAPTPSINVGNPRAM